MEVLENDSIQRIYSDCITDVVKKLHGISDMNGFFTKYIIVGTDKQRKHATCALKLDIDDILGGNQRTHTALLEEFTGFDKKYKERKALSTNPGTHFNFIEELGNHYNPVFKNAYEIIIQYKTSTQKGFPVSDITEIATNIAVNNVLNTLLYLKITFCVTKFKYVIDRIYDNYRDQGIQVQGATGRESLGDLTNKIFGDKKTFEEHNQKVQQEMLELQRKAQEEEAKHLQAVAEKERELERVAQDAQSLRQQLQQAQEDKARVAEDMRKAAEEAAKMAAEGQASIDDVRAALAKSQEDANAARGEVQALRSAAAATTAELTSTKEQLVNMKTANKAVEAAKAAAEAKAAALEQQIRELFKFLQVSIPLLRNVQNGLIAA
jgi:methyl-accepting chemotaxis protein